MGFSEDYQDSYNDYQADTNTNNNSPAVPEGVDVSGLSNKVAKQGGDTISGAIGGVLEKGDLSEADKRFLQEPGNAGVIVETIVTSSTPDATNFVRKLLQADRTVDQALKLSGLAAYADQLSQLAQVAEEGSAIKRALEEKNDLGSAIEAVRNSKSPGIANPGTSTQPQQNKQVNLDNEKQKNITSSKSGSDAEKGQTDDDQPKKLDVPDVNEFGIPDEDWNKLTPEQQYEIINNRVKDLKKRAANAEEYEKNRQRIRDGRNTDIKPLQGGEKLENGGSTQNKQEPYISPNREQIGNNIQDIDSDQLAQRIQDPNDKEAEKEFLRRNTPEDMRKEAGLPSLKDKEPNFPEGSRYTEFDGRNVTLPKLADGDDKEKGFIEPKDLRESDRTHLTDRFERLSNKSAKLADKNAELGNTEATQRYGDRAIKRQKLSGRANSGDFGQATKPTAGGIADKAKRAANAALKPKQVAKGLAQKFAKEVVRESAVWIGGLILSVLPYLLIFLAVVGFFGAIVLPVVYCYTDELNLHQPHAAFEFAMTQDDDWRARSSQLASVITKTRVKSTSDLGKFLEENVCTTVNPNFCGQPGNVTGGASTACIDQQLAGKSDNDTVKLYRAQLNAQGQLSQQDVTVASIKEVINAGKAGGVSTEAIAFTLSKMATESYSAGLWQADNGLGCYGITQICSGSFGARSYETWTQRAIGRIPSPQEFKDNPVMQMQTIEEGIKDKKAILAAGSCSLVRGLPEVNAIGWLWLGCGRGDGSVTGESYGEATEKNFNSITCNGAGSSLVNNIQHNYERMVRYASSSDGLRFLLNGGSINAHAETATNVDTLKNYITSGKIKTQKDKDLYIQDLDGDQGIDQGLADLLTDLTTVFPNYRLNTLGNFTNGNGGGKHNSSPIQAADFGGTYSENVDGEEFSRVRDFIQYVEKSGISEKWGLPPSLFTKAGQLGIADKSFQDSAGSLHLEVNGGVSNVSDSFTLSSECSCGTDSSSDSGISLSGDCICTERTITFNPSPMTFSWGWLKRGIEIASNSITGGVSADAAIRVVESEVENGTLIDEVLGNERRFDVDFVVEGDRLTSDKFYKLTSDKGRQRTSMSQTEEAFFDAVAAQWQYEKFDDAGGLDPRLEAAVQRLQDKARDHGLKNIDIEAYDNLKINNLNSDDITVPTAGDYVPGIAAGYFGPIDQLNQFLQDEARGTFNPVSRLYDDELDIIPLQYDRALLSNGDNQDGVIAQMAASGYTVRSSRSNESRFDVRIGNVWVPEQALENAKAAAFEDYVNRAYYYAPPNYDDRQTGKFVSIDRSFIDLAAAAGEETKEIRAGFLRIKIPNKAGKVIFDVEAAGEEINEAYRSGENDNEIKLVDWFSQVSNEVGLSIDQTFFAKELRGTVVQESLDISSPNQLDGVNETGAVDVNGQPLEREDSRFIDPDFDEEYAQSQDESISDIKIVRDLASSLGDGAGANSEQNQKIYLFANYLQDELNIDLNEQIDANGDGVIADDEPFKYSVQNLVNIKNANDQRRKIIDTAPAGPGQENSEREIAIRGLSDLEREVFFNLDGDFEIVGDPATRQVDAVTGEETFTRYIATDTTGVDIRVIEDRLFDLPEPDEDDFEEDNSSSLNRDGSISPPGNINSRERALFDSYDSTRRGGSKGQAFLSEYAAATDFDGDELRRFELSGQYNFFTFDPQYVPQELDAEGNPIPSSASRIKEPTIVVECRQVASAFDGTLQNPLPGGVFTSPFGSRTHPVTGKVHVHSAVDIAKGGGAEVVAAASGKVTAVVPESADDGCGNYVFIDHGNNISTGYCHLASFSVSQGDEVAAGQVIGIEGTTGTSTGVHLHFIVKKGGIKVDPCKNGLTCN